MSEQTGAVFSASPLTNSFALTKRSSISYLPPDITQVLILIESYHVLKWSILSPYVP